MPEDPKRGCAGCKTAVGVLENWVASNKTETQIIELFDNFCTLFTNTEVQEPCERLIEFGVPKVINFLEKRFPPERICTIVGACVKPALLAPSGKIVAGTDASPFVADGKEVLCDGCKIMVDAVHAWVNAPSMRNMIDSLFDKMCVLFNSTDFQPVCEDIVNYGIDKIIKFTQDKLTSERVCGLIKVCPAKEQVRTARPAILPMPRLLGNARFNVPVIGAPHDTTAGDLRKHHNMGVPRVHKRRHE